MCVWVLRGWLVCDGFSFLLCKEKSVADPKEAFKGPG